MKSKKITDSSRDKECTLNISGVCNYDSETTVFAHLPSEKGGKGFKSSDLCCCDACSSCHDCLDGRRFDGEFETHKEFYMRRAQLRTLERLFDEGILCIK